MAERAAKVAGLPEAVDADLATVRARLGERLLRVGSTWFPTPKELRAWSERGLPLYVRLPAPDRAEVGPRLDSLWAACFSPVWEARMSEAGGRTTLRWSRRLPAFTVGLLSAWVVVLVLWGVALAPPVLSGEEHWAWVVFWAVLAGSTAAGPGLGWSLGGRALDAALPALREALEQPEVGEDW